MNSIASKHPRFKSLTIREQIIHNFNNGSVVNNGLIAHGRGEAFDYLIGEITIPPTINAIKAAAITLLNSHNPVISVNGNVAALVPTEIVKLSNIINCKIEINLFHHSKTRAKIISDILYKSGAKEILGLKSLTNIPEIFSNRSQVDPEGIFKADTVLVPLEDGDRVQTLVKMGKKVIVIDLNPLSRSSKYATISIIDNVVRAFPLLISYIKQFKNNNNKIELNEFHNSNNLKLCLKYITKNLSQKFTKYNFKI